MYPLECQEPAEIYTSDPTPKLSLPFRWATKKVGGQWKIFGKKRIDKETLPDYKPLSTYMRVLLIWQLAVMKA